MLSKVSFVAAASAAFLTSVAAHGQVHHVKANGVSNDAPNQYFSGDSKNSKTVTRVMYKSDSPAFVLPSQFGDNSKMACEGSGDDPAPHTLEVAAGGTLSIFWEGATPELQGKDGAGGTSYKPWVHAMGPVLDYITSCNGPCNKFDATNAGWTKLAHSGIDMGQSISGGLRSAMQSKPEPYFPKGNGLWAMAKLIQQGSKWDVKIPSSLKSGEYIVRHELAAIHNPLNGDPSSGAQHYIACVQVKVTGGGDVSLPGGTKAGNLYSSNGEYAKFSVYSDNIGSFNPPGPAVWDQSSSADNNGGSDGGDSGSGGNGGGNGGSGSGGGKGSSGGNGGGDSNKGDNKGDNKDDNKGGDDSKSTEGKASSGSGGKKPACKNRKRGLGKRAEGIAKKHRRSMFLKERHGSGL